MDNDQTITSVSELLMQAGGLFFNENQQNIQHILGVIRSHLGMPVAFISQFENGRRVYQFVDTESPDSPVQTGASDPLEDTYCQRVVDGRLPEIIPDTSVNPAAMDLSITRQLPIGAHLSVPIRLTDGSLYGTFCCFSHTPNRSLNGRDLALMRAFADLSAQLIENDLHERKESLACEQRISQVLAGTGLSIVYQPIVDLLRDRITGFEALSRFAGPPARTPDVWFNEAASVNLGVQLETKAAQLALQAFQRFPAPIYVSVNASPEMVLSGSLRELLSIAPLERTVLEITEHALVNHYDPLASMLNPLRDQGLRIAVDDAGAGFASFRHILNLAPDLIKLDMSLTRHIDQDKPRRLLAAALIRFATETDSEIVAEGVESAAELHVLRELGVAKAQGYYLGRPIAPEQVLPLLDADAARAH